MTGWIIFGAVLVLLSLPLFIPLRLRVGLDEERRDWSVHVATLQVAPEGEKHWQEFRTRWGRRLKPLRIAGSWLLKALLFLLSGLGLAFRGILWLFRTLVNAVRWPFTRTRKPPQRPEPTPAVEEPHEAYAPPEPDSGEGETTPPAEGESGEIRRESEPPEFSSEQPEPPPEPTGSDLYEDLDDLASPGGTAREDEETEERSETSERGVFDTIRLGYSMLELYGPLGWRLLQIALGFVGDIFRVPRWRRFDGRLAMGGDPAAMGALLGWEQAILASIDPRLLRHLRFEPDFNDPDRPVSGSLDFDVVVWPYRFVLPILRLIVRIPWFGLLRVYRRYRSGDLIPDQNSGVA